MEDYIKKQNEFVDEIIDLIEIKDNISQNDLQGILSSMYFRYFSNNQQNMKGKQAKLILKVLQAKTDIDYCGLDHDDVISLIQNAEDKTFCHLCGSIEEDHYCTNDSCSEFQKYEE